MTAQIVDPFVNFNYLVEIDKVLSEATYRGTDEK